MLTSRPRPSREPSRDQDLGARPAMHPTPTPSQSAVSLSVSSERSTRGVLASFSPVHRPVPCSAGGRGWALRGFRSCWRAGRSSADPRIPNCRFVPEDMFGCLGPPGTLSAALSDGPRAWGRLAGARRATPEPRSSCVSPRRVWPMRPSQLRRWFEPQACWRSSNR